MKISGKIFPLNLFTPFYLSAMEDARKFVKKFQDNSFQCESFDDQIWNMTNGRATSRKKVNYSTLLETNSCNSYSTPSREVTRKQSRVNVVIAYFTRSRVSKRRFIGAWTMTALYPVRSARTREEDRKFSMEARPSKPDISLRLIPWHGIRDIQLRKLRNRASNVATL